MGAGLARGLPEPRDTTLVTLGGSLGPWGSGSARERSSNEKRVQERRGRRWECIMFVEVMWCRLYFDNGVDDFHAGY